jgi:hypothetical protein
MVSFANVAAFLKQNRLAAAMRNREGVTCCGARRQERRVTLWLLVKLKRITTYAGNRGR